MACIVNFQHYTYKVAFQALGKHLALVIEYYRSLGEYERKSQRWAAMETRVGGIRVIPGSDTKNGTSASGMEHSSQGICPKYKSLDPGFSSILG